MRIGYTMMCEHAAPRQLVRDVVRAEEAGFDFAVISDHYSPWLDEMGHSPYTWSVLGAAAWATKRIPLMTYVTCPTFRYHPVVVAQKAATVQLLSQGRFTLGLGAGENLNEHVVGVPWPPVDVRHARLVEAIEIIRALFDGGYVNYRGAHFQAESAKLWDLPDAPPAIGVAVSGSGWGKPKVGQVPVCFDADRESAMKRAHELFRWFDGGWKVNAELPGTAGFDAASSHVSPEDVAKQIPCGNDVSEFVEKIKPFADAGFSDVALVQIGGSQQAEFIDWAQRELLPALRDL
jgi:hypothetical protein